MLLFRRSCRKSLWHFAEFEILGTRNSSNHLSLPTVQYTVPLHLSITTIYSISPPSIPKHSTYVSPSIITSVPYILHLLITEGMLCTSTAPLPMRYTTMGYTSIIYTSTALYFYKQSTQATNKIFLKHFKQKICK
jgi:hypothetical protein